MFLQALYKRASSDKLLDNLPFQRRTVHLAIPLRRDGTLRGDGLVLFTTKVRKGKTEKEEIGQEVWLPRFPGENNGGKAYYLAEQITTVLGLRKEPVTRDGAEIDAGHALPIEAVDRKDRNPVVAYHHFWERIEEAFTRTRDERLGALLEFQRRYLTPSTEFARALPFIGRQQLPKAKEPEFCVRTDAGTWQPVKKANVVQFEVEGQRIDLGNQSLPAWKGDRVWEDWSATFLKEAYAEADEELDECQTKQGTLCIVSGNSGLPIARSHKPKILGVPGLTSGGYVVSFAKAAPAFSSYGFEMGENAPVSEQAAASYALALNELLASDDTRFSIGEVVFCFWAEKQAKATALTCKNLATANPKVVAVFLKSPFAGIDRELAKTDQFLSVALSANAGRVVVREWVRVPLDWAIESMQQWFASLQIVALGEEPGDASAEEGKSGPYSLYRLAAAMVRDSKELKRISEIVAELYLAAVDRSRTVPLRLLDPVLAEFRSALVTDSPKKPRYPMSQSRFALIKLILTHHAKEGAFMPAPQLCETDDQAYNLGRLLCVLAALQDKAHEYQLEGPGIVERYYGTASSAPAGVFAVLWKLHNHHLRKVEQQGDKGRRDAFAIRGRIAEIAAKFAPAGPNQPPQFPRQLSLEEQGRFALGYYQQLAADRQAIRESKPNKTE